MLRVCVLTGDAGFIYRVTYASHEVPNTLRFGDDPRAGKGKGDLCQGHFTVETEGDGEVTPRPQGRDTRVTGLRGWGRE